MNCERIESLLPVYVEKDLPDAELEEIEAHLEACAACRESLAGFAMLEEALLARREEVPSAKSIYNAVFAVTGCSRLKRVLDAIYSLPFLCSASFFITGVILFVYRRHIETLFARDIQFTQKLSRVGEQLTSVIINLVGGDVWVLTAVYFGLTAIILLGTALMVRNFVRGN